MAYRLYRRDPVQKGNWYYALYQSPFTDITPSEPEALFTAAQIDEMVRVLESVPATAVAA